MHTVWHQIFRVYDFHGLAFSNILRQQFSRTKDSAIYNQYALWYSKIWRGLIFELRCQSVKNEEKMRLENLALYGSYFMW